MRLITRNERGLNGARHFVGGVSWLRLARDYIKFGNVGHYHVIATIEMWGENHRQTVVRGRRFNGKLRDLRNNLRNMRTSPALEALFPKVRHGILTAAFMQPEKWWYLSELAAYGAQMERKGGALKGAATAPRHLVGPSRRFSNLDTAGQLNRDIGSAGW